jgi:predicted ABC-type ATPase
MSLTDGTPRIRMFAGPNGSGKSTMKSEIRKELLSLYINPDEIEVDIRKFTYFDFSQFGIKTTETEIHSFFNDSTLLKKAGLDGNSIFIKYDDNKLRFQEVEVNAYYASVLADFIRQKLMLTSQSFTFETVMSSPDKINVLKNAQEMGYRTYLYFVATENPIINISRVKHRVKNGGHDVPSEKVKERYFRSLDLLWEAVKYTNRAYLFDNSGSDLQFLAEIIDGQELILKKDVMPNWFKTYIFDKINITPNKD